MQDGNNQFSLNIKDFQDLMIQNKDRPNLSLIY